MKQLKSWTIRWTENESGNYRYEKVIATNIAAACKWCVNKTDCPSMECIDYVSGEACEIAEE